MDALKKEIDLREAAEEALKKERHIKEAAEGFCNRYQVELRGARELRAQQETLLHDLQDFRKNHLDGEKKLQEELSNIQMELLLRPTEDELKRINELRANAERDLLQAQAERDQMSQRLESRQKIKADHEAKLMTMKGEFIEHIRKAQEENAELRNTNKQLVDQLELLQSDEPKRKKIRRSERIEKRTNTDQSTASASD